MREEVTGDDHDVRRECAHAIEGVEDVVIGHLRPDVKIAELCERLAGQHDRQLLDRKFALDDLEPVWLDFGCICEGADGGRTERDCGTGEEGAAIQGVCDVKAAAL